MIDFLLMTLATYAVSLIVATEYGPFAIFERWRLWLESGLPAKPEQPPVEAPAEAWANWQDIQGEMELSRYASFRGTLWGIFECPICLGAYVSLVIVLATHGLQSDTVLVWLAAYGGHLFLFRLTE